MKTHWIDRATAPVAPIWTLKRQRARMAAEMIQRHYEAASGGRRTSGWHKTGADANAVIGAALKPLRDVARDLVRNNGLAESALSIITNHTVDYGIMAKPAPANAQALAIWKQWAETTACDADGRNDFYGLQKLVVRTVVESGEVLVRRRIRRLDRDGIPEFGLPLPLQLQVLDPDFLDTSKDVPSLPNGGRIIQGVEFNAIGQRVAYWLFSDHPGATLSTVSASRPVPVESILHIFKQLRPGQVRGPSWFTPVLLPFKEFDELADATLMKQKVASCLTALVTDTDGVVSSLGNVSPQNPDWDTLEPGAIKHLTTGQTVTVVEPPSTREYPDYVKTVLRSIATGMCITYEDLTGDYSDMNFSASRASHIKHWQHVNDWRWRMLIPQFCDPSWQWAMEAAAVMNKVRGTVPTAKWSPPPPPMIDPVNEGLAYMRNIRIGIQTWPEVVREMGYDPDEVLAEVAAFNKKFDDLAIVFDCDPRKMTQAGQMQSLGGKPATTNEQDAENSSRAVLHAVSLRR